MISAHRLMLQLASTPCHTHCNRRRYGCGSATACCCSALRCCSTFRRHNTFTTFNDPRRPLRHLFCDLERARAFNSCPPRGSRQLIGSPAQKL
jgi:hypothetical protein